MAKPRVVPAILAASEAGIQERIAIARAWKTSVHLDIVDGRIARPKSAAAETINVLPRGSEVHLMVKNPMDWKKSILRWRPQRVILHVESENISSMVRWLQKQDFSVSLAIKTTTSVSKITPHLQNISGVHIMMGKIGSYGSVLESEMWLRVKYFAEEFPKGLISVDVGIDPRTWRTAKHYGATRAAVGSFLFSSKNPTTQWNKFLQ